MSDISRILVWEEKLVLITRMGLPILVYALVVLPVECTCRMANTTSWLKLKLDLQTYHCGLASVVQVGTDDIIG